MLLLHWEYAKTCFHLDPLKNSAPTLGVDRNMIVREILHVLKKIMISLNMWFIKRDMAMQKIKKKDWTHEGPNRKKEKKIWTHEGLSTKKMST